MMNRRLGGTILVSALLIFAAFTIAVTDVSAATSPSLGSAQSFAILAATAITNVPTSAITGDVGLTPHAGSYYAGLTAAQVTGTIYAVDTSGPAGSVSNPTLLNTARGDLVTAYGALASQGCDVSYTGVKDLAGLSLVPGVYCATAFTLSGTLTLQGSGVWIFKSTSTLITSGTANVVGGDPCNVWWWVASSATLGTNTKLIGNILALADIELQTGARLNGRALAQTAAVTLESSTINRGICSVATTTIFTTTYTTIIGGVETTITTLTTIVMYGPGPIGPVGGEILPVDALQLFAPYFVAILIAATAIGLAVMYKRRTR